jgi:CMP-2-keto-3-deoxyoctulosonic acid synthetase
LKAFGVKDKIEYQIPKRMKRVDAMKLTKAEAKAELKKYKDNVILNYCSTMKVNTEEVERLEALRLTKAQLEEERERMSSRESMELDNDVDDMECVDLKDVPASKINGKSDVHMGRKGA